MSNECDHKILIDELETILDNYTEWFMGVVRAIFYPTEQSKKSFSAPAGFSAWIKKAYEKKLFPDAKLDDLNNLNADLLKRASTLSADAQVLKNPPPYADFDKLATFYEEFISLVRRLEKEYYLGISGIDPKTGLRSRDMFFKDIQRELERLERQGKPFCLALAQIDRYSDLCAELDDASMDQVYNHVANMIKKSTRSFDDAYAMDNGSFVLSLKQTGLPGGVRALQRLNAALARERKIFKLSSGPCELTLSSCVSEPLPEDNVNNLLSNMKKDLGAYVEQRGGMLIEYADVSPLERMAKSKPASS